MSRTPPDAVAALLIILGRSLAYACCHDATMQFGCYSNAVDSPHSLLNAVESSAALYRLTNAVGSSTMAFARTCTQCHVRSYTQLTFAALHCCRLLRTHVCVSCASAYTHAMLMHCKHCTMHTHALQPSQHAQNIQHNMHIVPCLLFNNTCSVFWSQCTRLCRHRPAFAVGESKLTLFLRLMRDLNSAESRSRVAITCGE